MTWRAWAQFCAGGSVGSSFDLWADREAATLRICSAGLAALASEKFGCPNSKPEKFLGYLVKLKQR